MSAISHDSDEWERKDTFGGVPENLCKRDGRGVETKV